MKPFPVALSAFLLLSLVACKKADRLVGSWTAHKNLGTISQDFESTFNADGTFKTDMTNTTTKSTVRLIVHDKGTWKVAGENRYETRLTDTDWITEGATPEGTAKARARFTKNKPQIIAVANKDPFITVTWQGDDQFTETESDMSFTFTRKK